MAFSDDGGASNYGDAPLAQINVTPLVDVMLVLLIIFMVAAPMLQQGVEVNLPKATSAPLAGTAEQLVISIDQGGSVFLGAGNKIETAEIGKKVATILAPKPEEARKVYIKADGALAYQVLMDVMSKLHESGITQIGLVSAPPGESRK